jgi:hypothetical protein
MKIESLLELSFFNESGDELLECHVSEDETTEYALAFLRLANQCIKFGGSEAEAEQFIDDAIKALEQE